jgi:hypothetical protein
MVGKTWCDTFQCLFCVRADSNVWQFQQEVPHQTANSANMRKYILLSLIGTGLLTTVSAGRAADVFAQNKALGRGVNVLGYDPIWLIPPTKGDKP